LSLIVNSPIKFEGYWELLFLDEGRVNGHYLQRNKRTTTILRLQMTANDYWTGLTEQHQIKTKKAAATEVAAAPGTTAATGGHCCRWPAPSGSNWKEIAFSGLPWFGGGG